MPANRVVTRRDNQRHRTRKDLLEAAARLLRRGGVPDMDEVAAEAMVSRATAYRYFPSVEALLVEAPLDGLIPGPERVFPADDGSTDPAERVDRAEAALHEACCRYEAQLRLMLAASLARTAKGSRRGGVPVRQNRRTLLSKPAYARLCAALAMVLGTESMIVFRDVLGLDERTARKVKRWTVRSLVAAALKDSDRRRRGRAGL
ncbi:MAG: TetR/AcrR family transcriptional regulator [Leptolyngbya sp.]|nr:TetR/AcrR family transcriptional regulator [Leptolyngbya sp.]